MNGSTTVSLRAVDVAMPSYLCERRGTMIESGIRKRPVRTETVSVSPTNIDGDGQGDLRVHGGPEKAVYAYPADHWPGWSEELTLTSPLGPGSFGENLTIAGILERDACIGDIWRWGEVRLQICQPRYPCYKLGEALGDRRVIARMVETGRTGWYFRVLTPGTAPASGTIEIEARDPAGVSVAMAHRARLRDAPRELIAQVVSVEALASGLRRDLAALLTA